MPFIKGALVYELSENSWDQSPVPGVCYPSPVVGLGYLIVKQFPRNLVKIGHHFVYLLKRDSQIHLGELVKDIPAKRGELPSFLYKGVEEAQTKEQFLPFISLSISLKKFGRVASESPHNVCLDSPWGLRGYFLSPLKKGYWEGVGRHRCEEQSEFARFYLIQFPFYLLEISRGDVAVLQDDPSSLLFGEIHEILNDLFLTLA